jgi:hypothetical protein
VEKEGGVSKRDRQDREEGSLAPVIGRWAETCFPVGSQTIETELRELLKEATDSARDNFGPEEAVDWAEAYKFPPEFVRNDLRCLEEAHGNFVTMAGSDICRARFAATAGQTGAWAAQRSSHGHEGSLAGRVPP